MKRIAPLFFAALVVVSCSDDQPPTTSPLNFGPQAGILDGAHPATDGSQNDHFYWLPELVASPTYTGTFNPDLPATIKICELTGAEPTEPANPVCAVGTEQVLFGAAEVSVDPVNEQYSAVWKTDDPLPDKNSIDSNHFYRLSVVVNGFELGYRDLDPEDSPPSGSGGKVAQFYPFKLGNTINIKFRIELGAFCLSGDPENCGECFYSASGSEDGNNDQVGRACNAGGQYGVYIPANNDAIDNVLVIPERILPGEPVTLPDGTVLSCDPDYSDPDSPTYGQVDFIQGLDIPQYPGCFFIRTIPELESDLDHPAVVGSCPEIPENAPDRLAVIGRTDNANAPTFVQALKPANTVINGEDFLSCDQPVSPLQSLAMAVKKLNPFYADPVEAGKLGTLKGGEAPSFSDFVWIVPSQEEKLSGDNQLGRVGTVLPEPLTVYVTDEVSSTFRAEPNLAVAGATVTFSIADGGLSAPDADNTCSATSSAGTFPVTTGLSGEAKVCVTLPSTAGTYSIVASGYGIGVRDQDWTINEVNGVGPYSHWNTDTPFQGNPIEFPESQDEFEFPIEVEFTVTACDDGQGVADVSDGVKDASWDCANTEPFVANLSGGKKDGTFYWMRNGSTFYFAVAFPVDETASESENIFTLYLNDTGSPTLTGGDDVLVLDGATQQFTDENWAEGKCPKGQSFCAFVDGDQNGEGHFQINVNPDGSAFYFYELKHDLQGGLEDIAVTGKLGAAFTLRVGKGAKGNTEWPGPAFGDYEQIIQ